LTGVLRAQQKAMPVLGYLAHRLAGPECKVREYFRKVHE